ncbi:MAG: DNA polymerase III subunit delta' [Anaerolineae bacterium]|nr:DNA polymerase III subunit delta' [Anaerolineae bacterium]
MGWEMVGHDWAVTLLSRRLAAGQVAHAYLFAGPPRIGKTRLAIRLAQAINCDGLQPPCGACQACVRIANATHPDVRVVQGAGIAGSLKIDQIRELQHEAVLAPYAGHYRVFILRHMDLATVEAANSLLKTLEEPPRHVVLILTAVSADALPPTVVSRCQRLDLRRVSLPAIEQTLRASGISTDAARLLARLSGGRVGWALDVGQDASALEQRRAALDEMTRLLNAGRVERLAFADRQSRDGEACRHTLELWASWWRDLLLVCAGGTGSETAQHIVNVDRSDELASLARQYDLDRVYRVLVALSNAVDQLDANVNARLAVEGLLLKLPGHDRRA